MVCGPRAATQQRTQLLAVILGPATVCAASLGAAKRRAAPCAGTFNLGLEEQALHA